jgi:RND family efflux transporter MFP subunit
LFPQAAGQVTAVNFEAEQQVPAGAVLLRLDDEAERLALELAELQLENARQQLARHERVAGSGAVAAAAVDEVRTAMAAARIAVAQAQVNLGNRRLTAPFAGVVGIPLVDVGDRVTESTAVTTFDDRQALLIDFAIPELFAQGLALGHAVRVRSWALPDIEVAGQVVAMESRIDPATRTLRIQARVPNADDRFRPGTSFAVRLQLGGRRFPAVSAGALQWDRDGAYVWRVTDARAERVNVHVLKRGGGWVLVDGPLAEGDRIVVEGVQRLRPNLPVSVRTPVTSQGEAARGQ